jgi:Uma2 family endonuclease
MAMAIALRRFTVDEYRRMADAGILDEDDRVELLDGQIIEMTPIGPPHRACVNRLNGLLARLAANTRATLSIQNAVVLGRHDAPEPDVAVLRYRADGYLTPDPGPDDTLLLIEVADSSLQHDRHEKVPRYAAAGIPEAWLVNLPGEAVEIYRNPQEGHYRDIRTARRGEAIAPLAFPDLILQVDDVLLG